MMTRMKAELQAAELNRDKKRQYEYYAVANDDQSWSVAQHPRITGKR